ncbi:uncharacterized protein LOC144652510 isoform X2 [Oculina patagonica]
MAAAALPLTTEEANFLRIARLVIIGGTTLLREIFDSIFPPGYLPVILHNPVTVKRLREARLSKPQWDCLYPTPGVYGKSADFDTSLLFMLLRTICYLTPPAKGWNALPTYTDHSLAAELARVKYYRNVVCGHMLQNMMNITDDEFLSLWKEISDSFLRIAGRVSSEKRIEWQEVIHKLLTEPVVTTEAAKNVQELLRWYANDTEVMSELTIPTQVPSLETVFQEKAQGIKKLLRKELKSKAQADQVVKHKGLAGVERGLEGTTNIAKAPFREEFNIKDQPKEVLQPAEKLTSSAGGARLRLYVDCEIISGTGLREGSSRKERLPQEDFQGPMVKSAPKGVFKKAHDCIEFQKRAKAEIEQVQIAVERLRFKKAQGGLEGTTHITETVVPEDSKDMKNQQEKKFQGTDSLRLALAGRPEAVACNSQPGETSQVSLGKYMGAALGQNLPSLQEYLNLVAQNYLKFFQPSKTKDFEGFVEYLENVRKILNVDTQTGPRPLLTDRETNSIPGPPGESSQAFLEEVKGATVGPGFPSSQHVIHLVAHGYLQSNALTKTEDLKSFVEYLENVLKVLIVDAQQGSVIITLECATLEILEGLWEDYNTGHMKEVVQKCLVTDDIIEEFGDVILTVTISEEEYKACQDFFFQGSDESNTEWSTTGKRKKPVSTLHSLDSKRMKIVDYTVKTSQEAVSEDAIETETGSMDQVETVSQAESEPSLDRLETVSESLSENKMKTASYAESERWEISPKGGVWNLHNIQAAACITFPRNAVTKPVLFRCTLWESTTNFPPLKKDEALVSNVIVLTYDNLLSSNFTGDFDKEVTVALCHSATNLQGYEVVIRELVDSDNNDWRDLETTNIWQASDTQHDPSSKPRVPFAEAKVTCCSAFAVICRLRTYTFSTNALGECDFTCKVQDYPDMSVTIPASVVHKKRNVQLFLKVQEIPRQWYAHSGIIIGPVLHITCSPAIQLGEPATITMPISLRADKIVSAEFSSMNVKVLVNTDEETSDWKDITEQLPKPAELTNGVVTFQATHFTR